MRTLDLHVQLVVGEVVHVLYALENRSEDAVLIGAVLQVVSGKIQAGFVADDADGREMK